MFVAAPLVTLTVPKLANELATTQGPSEILRVEMPVLLNPLLPVPLTMPASLCARNVLALPKVALLTSESAPLPLAVTS